MMATLIKLTEGEKRLLIVLFIWLLVIFVLVGYLVVLIKKVMKRQGTKADEMLKNVVEAEYFDKEKQLIRFGIRKNMRLFFNEAKVPFIILCIAWFGLLLYCLFSGNWHYNVFNRTNGFGTILYKFDETWPKAKFFGVNLVSGFPDVIEKPHFEWSAWFSYLFVPINIVGIIWFLIYTQSYISRSIRIYAIARGIYRKKLVPDETPVDPASPAAPENTTNSGDSTLSS